MSIPFFKSILTGSINTPIATVPVNTHFLSCRSFKTTRINAYWCNSTKCNLVLRQCLRIIATLQWGSTCSCMPEVKWESMRQSEMEPTTRSLCFKSRRFNGSLQVKCPSQMIVWNNEVDSFRWGGPNEGFNRIPSSHNSKIN